MRTGGDATLPHVAAQLHNKLVVFVLPKPAVGTPRRSESSSFHVVRAIPRCVVHVERAPSRKIVVSLTKHPIPLLRHREQGGVKGAGRIEDLLLPVYVSG